MHLADHTLFSNEDVLILTSGIDITLMDASTARQTYLVRLNNNRQFQISEQMYLLLCILKFPTKVCDLLNLTREKKIHFKSEEQLFEVLNGKLKHFGVIVRINDSSDEPVRDFPQKLELLSLTWRKEILSFRQIVFTSDKLKMLFNPIIVSFVVAFICCSQILLYTTGITSNLAVKIALERLPELYLISIIGAFVHEFGHLAACRYFRCKHGGLGVGLYFFSPVLFVDVSQAWRLPRLQRAAIDIGGIYFNLMYVCLLSLLFLFTRDPLFIVAGFVRNLSTLVNLNPVLKLDGYWLFSDLTGITNLHQKVAAVIKNAHQKYFPSSNPEKLATDTNQLVFLSHIAKKFIVFYIVISTIISVFMVLHLFNFFSHIIREIPNLLSKVTLTFATGQNSPNFNTVMQLLFFSSVILTFFIPLMRLLVTKLFHFARIGHRTREEWKT